MVSALTLRFKVDNEVSGNDVIVRVGENTITLKDLRYNSEHVIIGEAIPKVTAPVKASAAITAQQ